MTLLSHSSYSQASAALQDSALTTEPQRHDCLATCFHTLVPLLCSKSRDGFFSSLVSVHLGEKSDLAKVTQEGALSLLIRCVCIVQIKAIQEVVFINPTKDIFEDV